MGLKTLLRDARVICDRIDREQDKKRENKRKRDIIDLFKRRLSRYVRKELDYFDMEFGIKMQRYGYFDCKATEYQFKTLKKYFHSVKALPHQGVTTFRCSKEKYIVRDVRRDFIARTIPTIQRLFKVRYYSPDGVGGKLAVERLNKM
jgi:hypothetical protein